MVWIECMYRVTHKYQLARYLLSTLLLVIIKKTGKERVQGLGTLLEIVSEIKYSLYRPEYSMFK